MNSAAVSGNCKRKQAKLSAPKGKADKQTRADIAIQAKNTNLATCFDIVVVRRMASSIAAPAKATPTVIAANLHVLYSSESSD